MKTIFKIHPFFYLFAIICILTGYFKNFVIITFIILFHEIGHILAGIYFNWKIEKVIILPFGGLTIFNERINRPILEEFIIALTGPIFQTSLFLFLKNPLFINYNLGLLLFNLLPILPLDGSKILNLLLNKILSFKRSHTISIIISVTILLLSFLLFKSNLILFLIFVLLSFKTYSELKNHRYIFNKFLFERYLYKMSFKKLKKVRSENKMKRDYRHLIFDGNKYITEREFLAYLFDK